MTQIEYLSRRSAICDCMQSFLDPLIFYSNYFYLEVLEFNSTKLLNIGTCSLYCVTQNNPIMYRVISSWNTGTYFLQLYQLADFKSQTFTSMWQIKLKISRSVILSRPCISSISGISGYLSEINKITIALNYNALCTLSPW